MREMWRTLSFPFLFGRAFIEAPAETSHHQSRGPFPFLFGRAFIEALAGVGGSLCVFLHFPSFSEGLSLRLHQDICPETRKDYSQQLVGLPIR